MLDLLSMLAPDFPGHMISFIEKADELPALSLDEAGKETFLVPLCLKVIVPRMRDSSKIPLHHGFLSMLRRKKT